MDAGENYKEIMPIKFLLVPIIGAFIGWITNVIAIYLLFHPYKRRFGIQGLLPKNKDIMAERLGKIVKEHLLDDETLVNAVNLEETIKEVLNKRIATLRLPLVKPVLMKLVPLITDLLKRPIEKELKNLPNIIAVDKIVEEKIKKFDLKELEKIIYQASGPEIRFIELAGGVLGFIIGFMQLIVFKSF